MARTGGQHNPPWTRDETILALDLFLDAGLIALSAAHPRVIALSNLLRTLPGNEERSANAKFRNPSGVAFKLSNLQSIAIGKGFANASAIDKSVWAQFGSRRQRVKEVAKLIVKHVHTVPLSADAEAEEEIFAEGQVFTRIHRSIERNRRLRTVLIRERRRSNLLRCDACFKTNPTRSSDLDDAIFDVHHMIPLSSQESVRTKIADVALLCANCHRIIHRLIATSGHWRSLSDLQRALDDDAELPVIHDKGRVEKLNKTS